MTSEHGPGGDDPERATRPASRLFAIRLWTEEVADGSEHRGCVREVASGAFRGFRDWSDLIAFLVARMDDDDRARSRAHNGEQG
jgi:hypothetical protein